MAEASTKLIAAVENYLTALRQVQASGGATAEQSNYVPLANLLNAIGEMLKPKVFCVVELSDQGAGRPDIGLYAASQVQKGKPRKGQLPERGVVEVKPIEDSAWLTAASDQVSRYWGRYRLVLVTNARDFVLVGEDAAGRVRKLETFHLADSAEEFRNKLETPRAFAQEVGIGLGEYLTRVLSHRTMIAEPRDLARLLASYARDGLARVERAETGSGFSSLEALRLALEEALGVHFKDAQGERFFHSTLIQTLFYGVFSAWVLWARQEFTSTDKSEGGFNWRAAVWNLKTPMLRALFKQIADPGHLQPLGLDEALDWASAAFERVDRNAFFQRFNKGEAVPYFYEPFLEAFDPELRKQLGVWYTPADVVRYMVARVDQALKDDLGIADGLAAENVYVLDPCCGTGAYLAETLHRIAANLSNLGHGALAGAQAKQAATKRVFGFEIMPAPLVVAHLQVELTLRDLGAELTGDESDQVQIILTNALTGWDTRAGNALPFPELEAERARAERVKQKEPILVILGNPPYNGFSDIAIDEERELSEAYRTVKRVRRPKGKGLNDLYIRFFRMAERRIAEKTGSGVICFISNYSWLDGLSCTGMREHYLEAFDEIRIDCLNGDKYSTGKKTPDGSPDPSIFSTEGDPVGIQVGTAIATLVRKQDHKPAQKVDFRSLWGSTKSAKLIETAEEKPNILYKSVEPILRLGLPFKDLAVNKDWPNWPALPDLFPGSFPGINTSRDMFLVDVDLERLKSRIEDYFNNDLDHQEIARRHPSAMKSTDSFNAKVAREALLARGGPTDAGFVLFAYRPFDNRYLYWEADTTLLHRKGASYKPHAVEGNLWLTSAQHLRKNAEEPQACFTQHLASWHMIERGASCFPAYLCDDGVGSGRRANLSPAAYAYLENSGLAVEDLFNYVLAILHDPTYRKTNAGALGMEWPRIPLPNWPRGAAQNSAKKAFIETATCGSKLAQLFSLEASIVGVTTNPLQDEYAAIAIPSMKNGSSMTGDDLALIAGWGRIGANNEIMPQKGIAKRRAYTSKECDALGRYVTWLGKDTFDISLNDRAFWRNIPAAVWEYKLGGYQVLKKWLSYRERGVLGRNLKPEEVSHFSDTARRIAAIILLTEQKSFPATQ